MPDHTPAPLLGSPFETAFEIAFDLHRQHVRNSTSVPYISHLMSVAALVLEDGGDEEEAIAALLHDVLEDCGHDITAGEIERRFGPRVRELVEACTDTPADFIGGRKPPWKDRKEAYIEHIGAGEFPLRVSLADKVHNARSILRDHDALGDAVWSRFSASREETLWYYRGLVRAYRSAGAEGFLISELDRIVSELEGRAGVART